MLAMTDASTVTLSQALSTQGVLAEAWRHVQQSDGAPGHDGMTIKAFSESVELRLGALARQIANGSYIPSPLRRAEIPKASGGFRMLGIPTVADRVLQTAAALWLGPRLEPLFSPASYAYRQGLGARRAADALAGRLRPESWVVVADIEKFFDNVEHDMLREDLRKAGIEDDDVRLILAWLSAQKVGCEGRFVAVKGLPQGTPVAPALANLFLTPFDRAVEQAGLAHVRYADDFVVIAGDETVASEAMFLVTRVLSERGLSVKPNKTDVCPVQDRIDFLGFSFDGRTRRISSAKVLQLRSQADALLKVTTLSSLLEARRALSNVVTGWYNYFGGASADTDEELSEIERWLLERLHDRACGLKLDAAATAAVAQPLGVRASDHGLGYPEPVARDTPSRPPDPLPKPLLPFSTRRLIRSQAIASVQAPVLSTTGQLHVYTHGSYLSRTGAVLTVRRKKATVFEVALDDLTSVTIEGAGVAVSSELLSTLAGRHVPLLICRPSGMPVARMVPIRSRTTTAAALAQLRVRRNYRGRDVACEMIAAKIANQRALLLYASKYRGRPDVVRSRLRATAGRLAEIAVGCQTLPAAAGSRWRTSLFLQEAAAAAHYWTAVAALMPNHTPFLGRHQKTSPCVVNAALNYGYWLLRNEVWCTLERTSLSPLIGILHAGRRRSAGLVYDLMEEFRQPVVDRAVVALIGRGSRLSLNKDRRLSLATRRRLGEAIGVALDRSSAAGQPLRKIIRQQAAALQRVVLGVGGYRGFRMPW